MIDVPVLTTSARPEPNHGRRRAPLVTGEPAHDVSWFMKLIDGRPR